jgi:hypothetical protein
MQQEAGNVLVGNLQVVGMQLEVDDTRQLGGDSMRPRVQVEGSEERHRGVDMQALQGWVGIQYN